MARTPTPPADQLMLVNSEIEKGESRLVISDENGRAKNYRIACAKDILKKAPENLAALAASLGVRME